jgi:dCMP deaminase
MKEKHLIAFMKTAYAFAECSHSKRLKVGTVIVKDNRIISIGYNGTPHGWDNECEYTTFFEADRQLQKPELVTREEVLHAETNAIAKLARSNESGEGSTLITTHSPCIECAKLIYQSGVQQVIFAEKYRNVDGLSFLTSCGVETTHFQLGAEHGGHRKK